MQAGTQLHQRLIQFLCALVLWLAPCLADAGFVVGVVSWFASGAQRLDGLFYQRPIVFQKAAVFILIPQHSLTIALAQLQRDAAYAHPLGLQRKHLL